MPYRALADFLEDLAQTGELLRVEQASEPTFEAIQATRQSLAAGNAVRLWTALVGHEFPIVENLFGSDARICRALTIQHLGELADRVIQLMESRGEQGGWIKLLGWAAGGALERLAPRKVRSGACQQIVRLGTDVDLGLLPFLRFAGPDSPPVIFAAPLLTVGAEFRQTVTGRFDLQGLDRQCLAVCWADSEEPAQQFWEYRKRREKMPVAIVFGGDPAFLIASAAVLPAAIDALTLAGLLRDKPLEVVAGRTHELSVPAEADLVLEGYIDPQEPPGTDSRISPEEASLIPGDRPIFSSRKRGPSPGVVIHATAITHRSNPVLPVWLPGPPPHEAIVIARTLQKIFLPLLKAAIPELVDGDFPAFGGARRWATLAVRSVYPGQTRRIAHAAWALRPFEAVNWLVLVDADVNVHDTAAVLTAVIQHAHPLRDLWSDAADERITIDATRKSRGIDVLKHE